METTTNVPLIVVVDHEHAILASMTSLLRRHQYAVHTFEASECALDFLQHNNANVIISDMRMSVLDGRDFLQQVAATSPGSMRIMMSSYEDKDIILDAISKGVAQYYIFKPWDDEALRETIGNAVRLQHELKNARVNETLKTLLTLPSAPKFQSGLWDVLAKPDKPTKELVAEIEQSPALVAKLLRVANSVYFGTRQNVTNLHDAIRLVGTQYVISMAISIETFGSAGKGTDRDSAHHVERIWEQCLRRAQIAKVIGREWGGFQQVSLLTIAALLQDIGAVIQICSMPKEFHRFRSIVESDPSLHAYVVEERIFGVTHDRIGESVLEYWSFPKAISTAVGNHHGLTNNDDLTTILQLANVLENPNTASPHDPLVNEMVKDWRNKI